MICYRRHSLRDQKYQITVEEKYIRIGQKYRVSRNSSQFLEWFLEDNQLIGFAIPYKGKWRRFGMSHQDCVNMQGLINSQVTLVGIKKFYRAIYILGKGSFGKVFKVQNCLDGKFYACKSMKCDKFYSKEDIKNEIMIQNKMEHKNILKILEVYEEDKHFYLITEFAEGDTLKQYLAKHDISDDEIIIIMKQILLAVNHIHFQGYVHRDIKPENILLMKYQNTTRITLTDFGFASRMDDIQTNHPYCGTPGYMAPEILNYDGEPYNGQCDIFSCGVLLYRLITGEDLFSGNQSELYYQQEHFNLDLLKQNLVIYTIFRDILIGMLENDPRNRLTIEQSILQFENINTSSEFEVDSINFGIDEIQQLKHISTKKNHKNTN